ncbi:MAG TPA: formyltransferase family protein, partial [Thermomicrobiales bacterium]|nr:formyltransferase family protein [Thermomicrobiales bacterium]
LRVKFELPGLLDSAPALERDFAAIGIAYQMDWRLALAGKRKRLAIFVSHEDHCLLELLWHHRAGDLEADIGLVVGNHHELGQIAEQWGIPFAHVPVDPANKDEAEQRQLALLDAHLIDLVVLARYMQVLSPIFISRWQERISTSTAVSCRPSSVPNPTPRPTSAASS